MPGRMFSVLALLLIAGGAWGEGFMDAPRAAEAQMRMISHRFGLTRDDEPTQRELMIFDDSGREAGRVPLNGRSITIGSGAIYALIDRPEMSEPVAVEVRTSAGIVTGRFVMEGSRDLAIGTMSLATRPFAVCRPGTEFDVEFRSLQGAVLARVVQPGDLLMSLTPTGDFWLTKSRRERQDTVYQLFTDSGRLVWSYPAPTQPEDAAPFAAVSADGSRTLIGWMKPSWFEAGLVVLDGAGRVVSQREVGPFGAMAISRDGKVALLAGSRGGLQLVRTDDAAEPFWVDPEPRRLAAGEAVLAGDDDHTFYILEAVPDAGEQRASLRLITLTHGDAGVQLVQQPIAGTEQEHPVSVVDFQLASEGRIVVATAWGVWYVKR